MQRRQFTQQRHWGGLRIHLNLRKWTAVCSIPPSWRFFNLAFKHVGNDKQNDLAQKCKICAAFKILNFCRISFAGFRMLPDTSKYCRISGATGYLVHP